MQRDGWQGAPLVGYPDRGIMQLLSGTHRREAAELTGTPVPVVVRQFGEVYDAWGNLQQWKELMNA